MVDPCCNLVAEERIERSSQDTVERTVMRWDEPETVGRDHTSGVFDEYTS
jgi:hypothetical protein